ncbi:MAG: hypothetical protein ACXWMJ_03095 [Syntrophales bacterium]
MEKAMGIKSNALMIVVYQIDAYFRSQASGDFALCTSLQTMILINLKVEWGTKSRFTMLQENIRDHLLLKFNQFKKVEGNYISTIMSLSRTRQNSS